VNLYIKLDTEIKDYVKKIEQMKFKFKSTIGINCYKILDEELNQLDQKRCA
jgi:hypothetical protein